MHKMQMDNHHSKHISQTGRQRRKDWGRGRGVRRGQDVERSKGKEEQSEEQE